MKSLAKYLILLLTLGLAATTPLFCATDEPASPSADAPAKPEHPRRERFQRRMRMLARHLKLTDTQKTSIRPLLKSEAEQMRAIHKDTSLSRDQKMAKVRTVMQATNAQIRGFLTPEQQQQLDAMKARRQERRAGGGEPAARSS